MQISANLPDFSESFRIFFGNAFERENAHAGMDLKRHIFRKLLRHKTIGEKHTAIEHTTAGIPRHLHGEAKEVTQGLIKEGFLLAKPTSYGLQISLNPERLEEIQHYLERGTHE